jgi:hypothetical protein
MQFWLIIFVDLSIQKLCTLAVSCSDQNSRAFKEVVIIRHPRIGEYALGFITSTVTLRDGHGDQELTCVYVPTNNLYLGDIFLMSHDDVIVPDLSVREAIGTNRPSIYISISRCRRLISLYSSWGVCCRDYSLRWHVGAQDYIGSGRGRRRWCSWLCSKGPVGHSSFRGVN